MNIVISYSGHDWEFDEVVKKLAPRNFSGSGFSFIDSRRDLSFRFKTKLSFERNLKKFKILARAKRSKIVRVESYVNAD